MPFFPRRVLRPVILLVFANDRRSGDGAWLRDLARERRQVIDALHAAERTGLCRVVSDTNVTHRSFYDLVVRHRRRIVGVHFGGHADPGGLRFEDDDGVPVPARMNAIAETLADLPALKWVFLNGCGTAEHVDALHARVTAPVVATERSIRDDIACDFADRFYMALGGGESLALAFRLAEREVRAMHSDADSVLRSTESGTAPWGGPGYRLLRPMASRPDDAWPWVFAAPSDSPGAADWQLVDEGASGLGWRVAAGALALCGLGAWAVHGMLGDGTALDAGSDAGVDRSVPVSAVADPSRGAASADAGAASGGATGDAVDGGPPDSGPPDSGPPDSGPPDSGPPDSGPPDVHSPVAAPARVAPSPPRSASRAPRCPAGTVDTIRRMAARGLCVAATDVQRRRRVPRRCVADAIKSCERRCGPDALAAAIAAAKRRYADACEAAIGVLRETCRDAGIDVACPRCGDGRLNGSEVCDDGNRVARDGCEPDCTLSGILDLPGAPR